MPARTAAISEIRGTAGEGATPRAPGALAWLVLSGLVIWLDAFTKGLALQHLRLGEPVAVIDGLLNWTLVYNPGAAFSFLSDASGWQRWFFTVLALGISAWLLALMHHHRHEKLLPAAFALIIGGALGNVYDRLVHGAVVDFLHFHYAGWSWPAFNLADSAITVGVVMMLWGQLSGHAAHEQPRPGAHS